MNSVLCRALILAAAGVALPVSARAPGFGPVRMPVLPAGATTMPALSIAVTLPRDIQRERRRRYLFGPAALDDGPVEQRMGWRPTGLRVARGGAVLSIARRMP